MLLHRAHPNWRSVLVESTDPTHSVMPPAVPFLLRSVTLPLEDQNSHKNLHTDDSGCLAICSEELDGWPRCDTEQGAEGADGGN